VANSLIAGDQKTRVESEQALAR